MACRSLRRRQGNTPEEVSTAICNDESEEGLTRNDVSTRGTRDPHETAVTTPFQSHHGKNIQQGSHNTMIVQHIHNTVGGQHARHTNGDGQSGGPSNGLERCSTCIVSVVLAACLVAVLMGTVEYRRQNPESSSLLSLPKGFVGRSNETVSVAKMLNLDGATVVSIVGCPGFGKSSLAVAVGHHLVSNGVSVYYVDLDHMDSVEEASRAMLRTVDKESRVMTGEETLQLIQKWARRFRASKVVILDNCDDLLHVNTTMNEFLNFLLKVSRLVTGPSFLITSRFEPTVLDIESVKIGPLSNEAAVTLLQTSGLTNSSLLSTSRAMTLAELAGNAPLALKLTGALIGEGVLPATLIKELTQHPISTLSQSDRQEEQIRFCIGSSFRRLSNDLKSAMTSLVTFPGSFDEAAAAYLLNMSVLLLRDTVFRPLKKRSLLEYNELSNEHYLHRLIRAFTMDEASEPGSSCRKTVARFIDYYLKKLVRVGYLYSDSSRQSDGLKAFEKDQQNFRHVLQLVIDNDRILIFDPDDTSDKRVECLFATGVRELLHARLPKEFLVSLYKSMMVEVSKHSAPDNATTTRANAIYSVIYTYVSLLHQMGDETLAEVELKRHQHVLTLCKSKKCDMERLKLLSQVCIKTQKLRRSNASTVLDCHLRVARLVGFQWGGPIDRLWVVCFFYYKRDELKDDASACYEKASEGDGLRESSQQGMEASNTLDKARIIDGRGLTENSNHQRILSEQGMQCSCHNINSPTLSDVRIWFSLKKIPVQYERAIVLVECSLQCALEQSVSDCERLHFWDIYKLLGALHYFNGSCKEAIDYFNKTVTISKKASTEGHPIDIIEIASGLVGLAKSLICDGIDDTSNYWEEILASQTELMEHPSGKGVVLHALRSLASWHWRHFNVRSAIGYYVKVYYMDKEVPSRTNPVDLNQRSVSKFVEPSVVNDIVFGAARRYFDMNVRHDEDASSALQGMFLDKSRMAAWFACLLLLCINPNSRYAALAVVFAFLDALLVFYSILGMLLVNCL